MTQQIPDLLPPEEAFETDENDPAPIQILQTQGRILAQRTKGAVRGEVEPVQVTEAPTSLPTTGIIQPVAITSSLGVFPSGEEARIRFWFSLYAPALNYRFRLFLVEHGEESYPLKIVRNRGGQPIVAKDRDQFYESVRTLLGEDRTKKLVGQMRQLVNARTAESG